MALLDVLTLLSYIALNVDILFQIRRIYHTKSSRDLSLFGMSVRYAAILIILIKFITLSDSAGFIVDKNGIDKEKLAWVMDLKNVRRGRIKEYADEFKCEYHEGTGVWHVGGEEFHQPHFLILNLAVGGTYTGITEESNAITAPFPAEYRVDWIRIYDNGFTVLGGIGPRELYASRTGSDVEISFTTRVGLDYDVVYKTDLTDPSWTLLQSVVGDGTTMSVYDPIGSPAVYYRVESSE